MRLAIDWLAAMQEEDGGWEGGPGVTGLALLVFLGAGETPQSGSCKQAVNAALANLRAVQSPDGSFVACCGRDWLPCHAVATLAIVEAYGLTQSANLRDPAQRGIDRLFAAQGADGGWSRSGPGAASDLATTVWAVFCARSAQLAELEVPPGVLQAPDAWLGALVDPATGAVTELPVPDRRAGCPLSVLAATSDARTAAAAIGRLLCGADPETDPRAVRGVDAILERAAHTFPDPGAAYFGTLAMWNCGGERKHRWRSVVRAGLVARQRSARDDALRGSWDSVGPSMNPVAARLVATCVHALCAETTYRYPSDW